MAIILDRSNWVPYPFSVKGAEFRERQALTLQRRSQDCWGCDDFVLPSELYIVNVRIIKKIRHTLEDGEVISEEVSTKCAKTVCDRCFSIYSEGEWYE